LRILRDSARPGPRVRAGAPDSLATFAPAGGIGRRVSLPGRSAGDPRAYDANNPLTRQPLEFIMYSAKFWIAFRGVVQGVLGLNEYRARCVVVPHLCFARLDDGDLDTADLAELARRLAHAPGCHGLPAPRPDQTVADYIEELAAFLLARGLALDAVAEAWLAGCWRESDEPLVGRMR
jgi:hypothetical protein